MLADLRVDELAAMRLKALVGVFLVHAHQPRVARHIGGEDRGETAFDGLFHSLPLSPLSIAQAPLSKMRSFPREKSGPG